MSEVAVVAWPDDVYGEVPVAFVVVTGEANKQELVNYCAKRIAQHKVPAHFEFVDELPKNERGKVLKTDLRARAPEPNAPDAHQASA